MTQRLGERDVAAIARLFGDPARARILMALADGRSLAASVLADEAGVSPSATSGHLVQLREANLVVVERSGRHRYHRLARPEVAEALEALATLAPAQPIRSLREHTRAAALRDARTCYDHLAGRIGVEVTAALVDRGALESTDGVRDTRRRAGDALSAPLPTHPYRLGPAAGPTLAALGVDLDELRAQPSRRPLLRFCLDWSEQRHHLGGRLGAALLTAFVERGWITRTRRRRVLDLTDRGARYLQDELGLDSAVSRVHRSSGA
ncbi:ArsR/SmtB family transcription factor [Pseudonocardia hierapolitana]|nr:metalloregulator ArsR/SmtB family transcription factor [Pseudonocardia hierapolitana]